MQTRLNYSITYHENEHLEPTSSIKWRTYEFYVSKAKTPRIHEFIIQSFSSFLQKYDVENNIFGSSTWEECKRCNDTSDYLFISIPVKNTSHKDMIHSLYKLWLEENNIFLHKQTESSLEKLGWHGCWVHNLTLTVSDSIYPLRLIAWMLKHEPYNIKITNLDINKTVTISPQTQPSHLAGHSTVYIERKMTEAEAIEADWRLSQMGITVTKREIK